MKITITFDLPITVRKGIRYRIAADGKAASYDECKTTLNGLVTADLESIVADYHADNACENCGCHAHLPRRCETCGCIWETA